MSDRFFTFQWLLSMVIQIRFAPHNFIDRFFFAAAQWNPITVSLAYQIHWGIDADS